MLFNDRVNFSINHSLLFSRLQSDGSITSEPFVIHGVSWGCRFVWSADYLFCYVGLHQPAESTILGCAVGRSVVIESSRARCHRSLPCLLVCQDEANVQWRAVFYLWEMQLLLEEGRLDVTTHLQVNYSISFRTLSLTGAYSFPAPVNCVRLIGEQSGTIYVLRKVSQISPQIQEWSIYSFRVLNPQQGITLAHLRVRPKAFRRSWLIEEENKVVLTHANYQDNRISIDILCLEEYKLENRTYAIPITDSDLQWSIWWDEGRWFGVASGTREGDPWTVHHRFWLLQDGGKMTLVAELAKSIRYRFLEASKVARGRFYCIASSHPRQGFLFMSSFEQPHEWQCFQLDPFPDFNTRWFLHPNLSDKWGHLVIIATINEGQNRRFALFKLRIEGVVDCFIEPYIVLPKGISRPFKVGCDNLMSFSRQDQVISIVPIQPQPLKSETVAAIERLMDGGGRRDGMGILVWEQNWREQLIQKFGNAITNYLW